MDGGSDEKPDSRRLEDMDTGGMPTEMNAAGMNAGRLPMLQRPQEEGGVPSAPLQQLLTALKSPTSPQQQSQVIQILKSYPQLVALFIKQRPAQDQQGIPPQQQRPPNPQMMANMQQQQQQQQQPNPGAMSQEDLLWQQQQRPRMQQAQQQQQQQMGGGQQMSQFQQPPHQQFPQQDTGGMPTEMNAAGMNAGRPPILQRPQEEGGAPSAPLQQLLTALKSPTSPQQQSQVIQILKSYPQLVALFIKQRPAQDQQGIPPQQQRPPNPQMMANMQQQQQQQQQPNPGAMSQEDLLWQQQQRLRMQQAQQQQQQQQQQMGGGQ